MFKHLASLTAIALAITLCHTTSQSALARDDGMKHADKSFITEAAQGGMAEVKLGQLAVEKGNSDAVKKFGQKMVEDHGKANDELTALAKSKNVELPADIGKHQKTYDKLAKLSGDDFDKAYIKEMVDDHKSDVKAFEKQAARGDDADLKTWAAKTLPTLQEHLSMIQDMDKAMNGGKGSDDHGMHHGDK